MPELALMTWPKARICAAAQMTEPGSSTIDHQPLHARRVALAEQVGEGGEPARPQRPREEHADDDDGRGVADGIDQRAGQPLLVDRAARGDDGLGAELGGKHREGDQAGAEACGRRGCSRLSLAMRRETQAPMANCTST